MIVIAGSFEQDRAKLADTVRRLRAVSGMSGVTVAERLGWSQSKVSKIETGRVVPSVEDTRALLDLYGAPENEREKAEDRARALNDRHRSLRMLRKRGLHRVQEDIGRRTVTAGTIRSFQPTMVPGLLQTPEYARAVFSQPLSGGETDVAQAVRARMDRQTALFDPQHSFHFVITEAALRWRLGSSAVMRAQMDRLANLSTAENLHIGVLPWNVPVPQVPKNGFVLLDEEEVSVESFTTHRKITEPRDVHFYLDVFQLFADAAVYDDEARAFLAELARDHA